MKNTMQKFIWLLSLLSLMLLYTCSGSTSDEYSFRLMSFNIRVNLPSDGENAWPHRKEMVASTIQYHDPDMIGVQEARIEQVQDLADRLPDYSWFGVGRDDGSMAGEFMAIFYRTDRFHLLEDSTFWLSQTPHKPGLGWDAAYIRTVTSGKFKDLRSNKVFYLLNTHFDNKGEIARVNSAHQILDYVNTLEKNTPVLVTGDFNATPDSQPYRVLTGDDEGRDRLSLIDAIEISELRHHGPTGTFSGFDITSLAGDLRRIDYIFVSEGVAVEKHATLSDSFDGRLPSDHLPIVADIILH